jgi:hypothetical protein
MVTEMADDERSDGGRSFAAQFSEIRQLENQKGRLEKSVLQARKRAEEFRMFRGDPSSTGSTDRVHEIHRQLASIDDATAAHARVARLELELRRSEKNEMELTDQVSELRASLDLRQAEVLDLRSELQAYARHDVRNLQAVKEKKGILSHVQQLSRFDRAASSPTLPSEVAFNQPEVLRLEEVVRQHQVNLPTNGIEARSVAALDAELEELDGQYHMAEAARHASVRAQLLFAEAELLAEMEDLGRRHEQLRETMAQELAEMQACEAESEACRARANQHRRLAEEAANATRTAGKRRGPGAAPVVLSHAVHSTDPSGDLEPRQRSDQDPTARQRSAFAS